MHVPSASGDDADGADGGQRSGQRDSPKHRFRMAVDALAGALAGCVSRVVVGPLDVIKIRFQVQLEPISKVGPDGSIKRMPKYTGIAQAFKTILKEEGVQGLWRGTVPGLLLTIPYTSVQFVALHQAKEAAAKWGLTEKQHPLNGMVSFGSGALAGAAGTVASYPFDLLRTTMAAQGQPPVYQHVGQAVAGIMKEQGVAGLYRGLGVTLVEIVPYAALQFGLYDTFRSAWAAFDRSRGGDGGNDSRYAAFSCGLLSGICAKLVSHPLDVAKKRYQIAGLPRALTYGQRVEKGFALQSLAVSMSTIYRAEGIAGLWKGSMPSIIKAAPAAAVTFTAYEFVLAWMLTSLPVAEDVTSSTASEKTKPPR